MENVNSVDIMEVEHINATSAIDVLNQGGAMMQTRSPYSTAVEIRKPRNFNIVIKRCEEEAAIAGDEFYYSWKQGGEFVEGLTVGAALAIARNWGNCAVDCKIEETATAYLFHGAFIDLETGFNLVRPFRQNKQSPKTKEGKDIYKGERGKDIIFQIGASKAIRNATLNAVPKWLASKVMKKAKENVVAKIEKMGVEKARIMIVKKADALKIPLERIEAAYGKEKGWDIERLVMLSGAIRSIEDGIEDVDTIFPIEDKTSESTGEQKQPTEPEQPKSENKTPEVESAAIVKEEPKSDENLFNELTTDMPEYYMAKYEKTKTKAEAAKLLKEFKPVIEEKFSAKIQGTIIAVFDKHDQTLKK